MRSILQVSLGFSLAAFSTISCDSAPSANLAGVGGSSPLTTATGGASCGSGDVVDIINDQGGCEPVPMAGNSGTLQGTGTRNFCLGARMYMLQVNEWNSTDPQNVAYGGGEYYFRMTRQDAAVATNGGPAGFPSMFIGANGGRRTVSSGMPKLVSSIASVPTTWNWKDNGATDSSTNIYNATYDVWFSSNANPDGDPGDYSPSGGFLMVWLHKPNSAQPIGSIVSRDVKIPNVDGTWNVWLGPNGSVQCISYVRTDTDPAYSMSFDLNHFIHDAVTNHSTAIRDDMYLTNIFTGFEIWSGGVGVETTSFCAAVN